MPKKKTNKIKLPKIPFNYDFCIIYWEDIMSDSSWKELKDINGVEMTSKEYNKYIRLFNKVDSNGRLPGDRNYNANTTVLESLRDKIIADTDYLTQNDQEKYEEIQADISNYSKHARNIIQNNSNIDIETGDLIGSPRLINLKN